MKNKQYLKGVAVAAAALVGVSVVAKSNDSSKKLDELDIDIPNDSLVLQPADSISEGHRSHVSHRSHSSHRSHYSSRQ